MSLNPIHGEVYSIKHYVLKFVSDSNFRHKSSNWNIKHLTSNEQMMVQKFVYVVHNIKHIWVIMWHIFTNNTTTILFPTLLWELLYTYHVIKQCTEKETTSLSNFLLTIKLNYLHDLKIIVSVFTASYHIFYWNNAEFARVIKA